MRNLNLTCSLFLHFLICFKKIQKRISKLLKSQNRNRYQKAKNMYRLFNCVTGIISDFSSKFLILALTKSICVATFFYKKLRTRAHFFPKFKNNVILSGKKKLKTTEKE